MTCRPALEATLAAEMEHLAAEAAEYPGHGTGMWRALAASTLADKIKRGFPVPSPLLRTGELQGSIRGEADGLIGVVGSTDPVAVYHEFGTKNMPPRPIYKYVMYHNMPHLEEVFGALAVRLLTPGGR